MVTNIQLIFYHIVFICMNNHYVYIYLNPLKSGYWKYLDFEFNFQPFYVGIGVGKRCYEHLTKKSLNSGVNNHKNNTIKKILNSNKKPIIIKLFEDINICDARNIEDSIIKHFGRKSIEMGLLTNIAISNITPVNSIGKNNIHKKDVYQYDLKGNLIKKWNCGLREIGRTLNVSYNNIADCCRGKSQKAYNSIWSYEYLGDKCDPYEHYSTKKRKKKIFVFDSAGMLIGEFKSIKDCCKEYNIDKSNISKYVNNKTHYNKKYYFSHDKKFNIPNSEHWIYNNVKYYKRIELQEKNQLNDYQYKKLIKLGKIKKEIN